MSARGDPMSMTVGTRERRERDARERYFEEEEELPLFESLDLDSLFEGESLLDEESLLDDESELLESDELLDSFSLDRERLPFPERLSVL
jgi:hypothetical protein